MRACGGLLSIACLNRWLECLTSSLILVFCRHSYAGAKRLDPLLPLRRREQCIREADASFAQSLDCAIFEIDRVLDSRGISKLGPAPHGSMHAGRGCSSLTSQLCNIHEMSFC